MKYILPSYNNTPAPPKRRSSLALAYHKTPPFAYTTLLLFAFSLFAFHASAQEINVSGCLPGLQHYFGMDEAGGGPYTDYVTGSTATCTTCPSASASLFGGAQRFNGKNKVDFTEVENFNWGVYGSFTIEFWMQTTARPSDNMVIIGRSPKDSDFLWWIGVDENGYATFELWDKNRKGFDARFEGKKINDGQWHHIAFVRDDAIKFNKLYIDGFAVVGFEYVYETGFESVSPVNIGYLDINKGHHYDGLLDELKIYGRALQENELREEYNYGAGNYCGPIQIAPDIISEPITFGVTGQTYSYEIKATGNPQPTYKILSGPAGLSVNATTGVLKWVPETAGVFAVTVQAGNSVGQEEQTFEVDVKQGLDEKLGTVHHWMLNETAGQQYKDYYTPYHATASEESKPMPVFGIVGGAQRFDGKNDALDVQESMNFDWEVNDNFSIELWMKSNASSSDNTVIIGRDSKNAFVHWWIGMDKQGQAGFQLIDAVFEEKYVGNSGPKLNDGKWHQIVAVRNSGTNLNSLYVDGEKVAEKAYRYTGGFESLAPVNMGYLNREAGYRFEGDLDEVKLFGRALSAAEIKERYAAVFGAYTELISFDGEYVFSAVDLTWATASEYNNSYFAIERASEDEQFTEIGRVDASGTTNVKSSYAFRDMLPLDGINLYRLRIVKGDGLYTYSQTIQVEKYGPTASMFLVYPNPVSGQDVNIKITNLPKDEAVVFMMTDLAGKKLLQKGVSADAVGIVQLLLPVPQQLRSGIYMLSVITKNKSLSRKLVVVR